jgi:hypothetical protein
MFNLNFSVTTFVLSLPFLSENVSCGNRLSVHISYRVHELRKFTKKSEKSHIFFILAFFHASAHKDYAFVIYQYKEEIEIVTLPTKSSIWGYKFHFITRSRGIEFIGLT